MTFRISPRAVGIGLLIGGLFVLWVSTIQPYWTAVHGDVGTRVYTGFGFKGSFFSPFVILMGLMLTVGGQRTADMIEGKSPKGRYLWTGLAVVGLTIGGLNTWWFRTQMGAMGYRNDAAAHMIKYGQPVYKSYEDAVAAIKATPPPPRIKYEPVRMSKEAWAAMSPEMRKNFSALKPVEAGKNGS